MARDVDADASLATSQSQRPALYQHDTDSQPSDHAREEQQHHQRPKHQKHVVGGGGRLHARVPSSKALHKHHGSTSSKLNRRTASPSPERTSSGHRRVQSDAKLSGDSQSVNLKKNLSHSSLRRNQSHGEVNKRIKSSEKIKRTTSHPAVNTVKSTKSQVHFDLGNDEREDEWVDASTSASPYLSRRGSVAPPAQSPANPGVSPDSSRPVTPPPIESSPPAMSTVDRERVQHKEYLTSRLLQRTPSYSVPPKMSTETASVPRPSRSPDPLSRQSTLLPETPRISHTPAGGSKDELTSRFVGVSTSGTTNDGSFYNPPRPDSRRSEDTPRRPRSSASLGRQASNLEAQVTDEEDDSALAPRIARRFAPPAEKSRTQQKLNLQRASSVIEPSQTGGGGGGVVGASPLVGVGGPGYDGGASRDPRVTKQLERTGMEYLSVRRHQNPVARSIVRVSQISGANKNQRIPRNGTVGSNTKRGAGLGLSNIGQHARNLSLTEQRERRPVTPKRTHSIRTNGGGSSFEAEEDHSRMHEGQGLSGSSLVGGDDDDGVTALLRNLWEKNMDLSASQD